MGWQESQFCGFLKQLKKNSEITLHRPAPAHPGAVSTWLLILQQVHPGTQLYGTTPLLKADLIRPEEALQGVTLLPPSSFPLHADLG